MTTIEQAEEAGRRQEEAERINPLLKKNLGQLVSEMIIIAVNDSGVLKPEGEVPKESYENYTIYQLLVKDIDRREREYQAYKPEPRY